MGKIAISKATKRNWLKLSVESSERLTKRANKKMSTKKILPIEYFSNQRNINYVLQLIDVIEQNKYKIKDVIYSIGIALLYKKMILHKTHVQKVLYEYSKLKLIDFSDFISDINDEDDLLGIVYQSLLKEGKKNLIGSYYTPKQVANKMTQHLDFSNGETILDPCCGGGGFLLALKNVKPNQIFGIDNDKIAVMIARLNLLLKFDKYEFTPQIFYADYLNMKISQLKEKHFNYIVTNPPWGAISSNVDKNLRLDISSNERFSLFFVKAFNQLVSGGAINFLFPESILNVKNHKDIRTFILNQCNLKRIVKYNGLFSGVSTKYVSIECEKNNPSLTVDFECDEKIQKIALTNFKETASHVFSPVLQDDFEILKQVKKISKYSLSESTWALGIVTGNNKEKLSKDYIDGFEEIYTGKEITPYKLKKAQNYIKYERVLFQQTAKEEYYRAKEKLVYKFISNNLIFAYDNSQKIFLNSANILIPVIPNMSVKTVMAFLNSKLFQYLYKIMFGEVKVLKGNLMQLPFPEISVEQNILIENLVDDLFNGFDEKNILLQAEIYNLYSFTKEQILYIENYS